LPLQDAATQTVPELTLRHAPAPSHMPSLPHALLALSSAQALWGSELTSTGLQVPSATPVSDFVQALQPPQVLSQQTPSVTTPEVHSWVCAAGDPFDFVAAQVPAVVLQ
jgi:hypothetical protein